MKNFRSSSKFGVSLKLQLDAVKKDCFLVTKWVRHAFNLGLMAKRVSVLAGCYAGASFISLIRIDVSITWVTLLLLPLVAVVTQFILL